MPEAQFKEVDMSIHQTAVAARRCHENTFIAGDGTRLFYRHWPALDTKPGHPRGTIVIFHRGHEHSGRVAHLADELELDGFDVFALDARGHGRSGGARGHSPSMDRSVADMDQFVRLAAEVSGNGPESVSIIAQSVGAVVAARWLQLKRPEIRCAVLAAPVFRIRLYVPFARPALALLRKLRGAFQVNSYVRPEMLTHDSDRAASYKTDPLITRPISVGTLLDVSSAGQKAVAEAGTITVPVQMLTSGSDYVVERRPQMAFFDRLACQRKERHDFPGFYHDTLGEAERAKPIAEARRFILNLTGPAAAA
jgi:alpha-beta hydrolase superfamily lysophospholipase